MKSFIKKYWGVAVLSIAFIGVVIGISTGASNIFTDLWTVTGTGTLNSTAVAWIDSARDMSLYDGDLVLGAAGSTPSKTAGAYPGYMIQFYNASGASVSEGDVLVSSVTANTSTGYTTLTTVVETTTVLGIAAGTVANGAVGWMRVGGWAVVKATGAIGIGDVVVTSATAGYCGKAVSTNTVVGASIGKAASTNSPTAASGSTILVKLSGL